MFSFNAKIGVNLTPDDLLAAYGMEPGGRIQRTIDQKVIDYCTPYAHYQYMGIVYGPNIPILQDDVLVGWFSPPGRPKHPTDRELTYDKAQNPMAGPYWFERMKADKLNDILDEARRVAIQGE